MPEKPKSSPPSPPPSPSATRSKAAETGETHKRFATTSVTDPAKVRAFAIEAARLCADDKCDDVVLLDVTGVSQLSDFIIIVSGTSDRQMHSTADDLEKLGIQEKYTIYRRHADERTTWIVADFVDVVVHIFEPNTRAHYDLEMLWSDAKRVAWERPDQTKKHRAGQA
ncbi:MAG: ribosome silencing factor [Phycisphaerales bacterium]|nr:ribosome silencing factor [Phycisphaerales bacterium]